jgi:PTS system mannose-specific IIA component
MIKIIIVAHGIFAEELLRSAESIVGKQNNIYTINISNKDNLDKVRDEINSLINDKDDRDTGTLLFVDMIGGSPSNACVHLVSEFNIEIVAGVNLPMLLSAIFNRKSMNIAQLAAKVCSDGQKTINTLKKL